MTEPTTDRNTYQLKTPHGIVTDVIPKETMLADIRVIQTARTRRVIKWLPWPVRHTPEQDVTDHFDIQYNAELGKIFVSAKHVPGPNSITYRVVTKSVETDTQNDTDTLNTVIIDCDDDIWVRTGRYLFECATNPALDAIDYTMLSNEFGPLRHVVDENLQPIPSKGDQ